MREEFATDKWLQFTNRQLSLLFQYSIMDDKGFHKVIKSLSLRMKIDSEQTLDFWRSVSSELNKDLSEDEYSDKLIKGKITDEMAEAILLKKHQSKIEWRNSISYNGYITRRFYPPLL